MTSATTRLWTVDEACELLRLGQTKLYELMNSGELPFIKLPPGSNNAGRRIEQAAIDAFLERNRVQT